MTEVNCISSIEDFFCFLEQEAKKGTEEVIYRGVEYNKSDDFKLIPSIGRLGSNGNGYISCNEERTMLDLFKQRIYLSLHTEIDNLNELELLALAQHHGLPTRLMDWTRNPLVAVYFSIRKGNYNSESSVFVWNKRMKIDLNRKFNPFKIKNVRCFIPKHTTNRITAQAGLFSIHPDPYTDFSSDNRKEDVKKVMINLNEKDRRELKKVLHKLGINEETLFPDIDGITRNIKWLRTDIY